MRHGSSEMRKIDTEIDINPIHTLDKNKEFTRAPSREVSKTTVAFRHTRRHWYLDAVSGQENQSQKVSNLWVLSHSIPLLYSIM